MITIKPLSAGLDRDLAPRFEADLGCGRKQ